MFSLSDYQVFLKNIAEFKNDKFFFFTFDEFFLVLKAIQSLMKINNISKKRVYIGKEFNMNEVIKEEANISFFKTESYMNIIYSSEDIRFKRELFDLNTKDIFAFIFSDKRSFERNKVLRELEKGVYVHFPKVDHDIALRWFSKELKVRGINIKEFSIQNIVIESEAKLTKLNNLLTLFELGAPTVDFSEKAETKLKELDIQSIINTIVSQVRKRTISPEILWKIYEPLLYNRRVNYDYELEIKQILRRNYEKRNKY
ncbi:MAG: hypothetical protein ABDH37_04185 [Candidatus Hydrothermales bacterium]